MGYTRCDDEDEIHSQIKGLGICKNDVRYGMWVTGYVICDMDVIEQIYENKYQSIVVKSE